MRRLILLAAVFLSTFSLHGSQGCYFAFDISALYWKMMQCYTVYVHQQTQPEANFFLQDIVPFDPNFDWGVEAKGGVHFGSYCAEVSYIWYDNRTVRTLSSDTPNLFPAGLAVASTEVRGVLDLEYQKLDARLTRELAGPCHFGYTLFLNGRWVKLDRFLETQSLSSPTLALNLTKETFNGGAFGLGVGTEWRGIPCIDLFAEINPMIAIGRRTDFESIFQGGARLDRKVRPEVAAVPAIDAKAGATWSYALRCMTLALEAGWSINYYWNVFPQNIPTAPTIRRVFNCDSIGFTGPFVTLNIEY